MNAEEPKHRPAWSLRADFYVMAGLVAIILLVALRGDDDARRRRPEAAEPLETIRTIERFKQVVAGEPCLLFVDADWNAAPVSFRPVAAEFSRSDSPVIMYRLDFTQDTPLKAYVEQWCYAPLFSGELIWVEDCVVRRWDSATYANSDVLVGQTRVTNTTWRDYVPFYLLAAVVPPLVVVFHSWRWRFSLQTLAVIVFCVCVGFVAFDPRHSPLVHVAIEAPALWWQAVGFYAALLLGGSAIVTWLSMRFARRRV